MNWRGRPLTSHEVVLNTIAATTTRSGLRVEAALDEGSYPTGTTAPAPRADERAKARAGALQMLADPRLTGMSPDELESLRAQLAPAQAAAAEQHRYMLRKGRRVATTGRSRSLLSDADEVLLTVIYLRQVCPQKVLGDLLGMNPSATASRPPGSCWTNGKSASRPPSCATSPVPKTSAPGPPAAARPSMLPRHRPARR